METVIVDLPGCKSASQRALVLAALAEGPSRLTGLSGGDDTHFLRSALQTLGVAMEDLAHGVLSVHGQNGAPNLACDFCEIGEGGSTLRFLLPLLATRACNMRLSVAPSLMARPHQSLLDLLRLNGAEIEALPSGFQMRGVAHALPSPCVVEVGLSSQFLSGLLMSSGHSAQSWQLNGPPVSVGYLEMTLAMLRQFRGAHVLEQDDLLWQQQAGFGRGQDFTVPADASAALFFAVAAALNNTTIALSQPTSAQHPDEYALQFLEKAGFMQRTIFPAADTVTTFRGTATTAVAVEAFDLAHSPDSGPALAVLAASNPTGIRFENAGRLRHKESDRIDGMARLASACGGALSESGDSLWIRAVGPAPQTTDFDPVFDHRLAMAAGVAALRWPGIQVTDPAVVTKSFPDFWTQLELLK
mgnify:CR=1 FL=1